MKCVEKNGLPEPKDARLYQGIDVPKPGVCPKCGVPDAGKEEA